MAPSRFVKRTKSSGKPRRRVVRLRSVPSTLSASGFWRDFRTSAESTRISVGRTRACPDCTRTSGLGISVRTSRRVPWWAAMAVISATMTRARRPEPAIQGQRLPRCGTRPGPDGSSVPARTVPGANGATAGSRFAGGVLSRSASGTPSASIESGAVASAGRRGSGFRSSGPEGMPGSADWSFPESIRWRSSLGREGGASDVSVRAGVCPSLARATSGGSVTSVVCALNRLPQRPHRTIPCATSRCSARTRNHVPHCSQRVSMGWLGGCPSGVRLAQKAWIPPTPGPGALARHRSDASLKSPRTRGQVLD